ncbi:hypothetical protein B9Z19DRAFT_1061203 [Tuber borchii]|uniref:Uncharacterized protein n=1 Tax=Tuber borchii TaxID=42251 RepID=A0A2T7A6A2_TUBBO|nr:hypothetical protein B9Z19DRAFT_1061203 [Tuber borchii]
MHGANGDASTNSSEFMSTIATAGILGNPNGDLTLRLSRWETLGSEGTFQTTTDEDLRIRDNPRERTKDSSESSEAGKDGKIEHSGTTLRRREGDPRGRAHEVGPSGIGEDESEIIVLIGLCCVADKTNNSSYFRWRWIARGFIKQALRKLDGLAVASCDVSQVQYRYAIIRNHVIDSQNWPIISANPAKRSNADVVTALHCFPVFGATQGKSYL